MFDAWIKSSKAYTQLENKLQELRTREEKYEQAVHEQKATLLEKNRKVQKLEKDLEHLRERLETAKRAEDEQRKAHAEQLEKAEARIEHLAEQVKALTAQLTEIDGEKREFRLRWEKKLEESELARSQEKKEHEKSLIEIRQANRGQMRALEGKASKAEEERAKLAAEMAALNLEELRKAKSRLYEYYHLYRIMRGHKEMAEERNKNWELALQILAGWILKEKTPERNDRHETLGALVAEALESIKAPPLVNDELS